MLGCGVIGELDCVLVLGEWVWDLVDVLVEDGVV